MNLIVLSLNQNTHKSDDLALESLGTTTLKPEALPQLLDAYQIFISPGHCKTFTLECRESDSIAMLKEKIMDKEGLRPEYSMLSFQGKILASDNSLSHYRICQDSTVQLSFKIGHLITN